MTTSALKSRLNSELLTLSVKLTNWLKGLSQREQLMVYVGFVVGIIVAIAIVVEPINKLINQKQTEATNLERDSKTIAFLLERYRILLDKRRELEDRFKEVELGEAPRSYLQKIIADKVNITGLPSINNLPVIEFGGGYELVPFSVQFKTTNLEGLVDFLVEVVQGKRPLILSKIEIRKNPIARDLDVAVEVNTIQKAGQG